MKNFVELLGLRVDKSQVNAYRVTDIYVELFLAGKETPVHIGIASDKKAQITEDLDRLFKCCPYSSVVS